MRYIQQAEEATRAQKNFARSKPRRVVTLLTALRTDTTHDLSQKRPERIQSNVANKSVISTLADLSFGRIVA